jgi:outer membrane protein OmpA-like peptidoglycan-associated protein
MKFSKIVAAVSVVVGGGVAYAQDDDVNVNVHQDTQAQRDMQSQRDTQIDTSDQGSQGRLTQEKSIKKTATLGSAEENKRACKSAELFFRFDSAALNSNDERVLKPLVDELNKYEGTTIVLDGFADPRGPETYNVILSGKRSDAVRDKLISMGAPQERIVLGLHGEKGDRRASYPDDRRVTAWITRNTTAQIVDHELDSGAQALAFGDQMKTIAELHTGDVGIEAQAQAQPKDTDVDVDVDKDVDVDVDVNDEG